MIELFFIGLIDLKNVQSSPRIHYLHNILYVWYHNNNNYYIDWKVYQRLFHKHCYNNNIINCSYCCSIDYSNYKFIS